MNKEIAAVLVCCVVGNIGDMMSGIAISGNATVHKIVEVRRR